MSHNREAVHISHTNLNLPRALALGGTIGRHRDALRTIGADSMGWTPLRSIFGFQVAAQRKLPDFVSGLNDSFRSNPAGELVTSLTRDQSDVTEAQRNQPAAIRRFRRFANVAPVVLTMPKVGESIERLSKLAPNLPISVYPDEQISAKDRNRIEGRHTDFVAKIGNRGNELLWNLTREVLDNVGINASANPVDIVGDLQEYTSSRGLGRVVLNTHHYNDPTRTEAGSVMPAWEQLVPELASCGMVYGVTLGIRPDYGGDTIDLRAALDHGRLSEQTSDMLAVYRDSVKTYNNQPAAIDPTYMQARVGISVPPLAFAEFEGTDILAPTGQLISVVRTYFDD